MNGIRARSGQVIDWIARDAPDIVCLQEIKARPDQLPPLLFEPEGYWCRWHGLGGYSGVAIFVKKTLSRRSRRRFEHPAFDFESRIVTTRSPDCQGRVGLRAERRQGLPCEDAIPRALVGVGG